MRVLHGIAVSPGVAIGEALVMDAEGFRVPQRFVTPVAIDHEIARFNQAIATAAAEIEENRIAVSRELGEQYGAIFEAHLQMVRDPHLHQEVEQLVRDQHYTPEHAISRVLQRYAAVFQNLGKGYLSERASDIFDIQNRLLRHLSGTPHGEHAQLSSPVLVLAHDLTPSETANLDRQYVRGLVTEVGGSGSHTAIMAGAMGIPAVVGTGPFLDHIQGGEQVIIDGDRGHVLINPDAETLLQYQKQAESHRSLNQRLATLRDLPAETLDGTKIQLLSNIEFPHEVHDCIARGSDGVGLYRTEFLYLSGSIAPTEEDQYKAYREVFEAMGERPVVIRTLDLGADKLAPMVDLQPADHEKNPFLGLRSIRLSLRNLPLFRTQLRAILRASEYGNARIMFPLISTLSELRQAKMVLNDVCEDLEELGLPFRRDLPIGMMVEVPAVVLTIERFVPEVDFFSIGTNDLIQYTLAVDRGNKEVASLYSASDPALLKLLSMVVGAANPHSVPVNVCGQMSGNPIYTMLLLGLGLRQLSVPASVLAEIKKVCRTVTLAQCQLIAARALTLEHARDVTRYLQEELRKVLPELVT